MSRKNLLNHALSPGSADRPPAPNVPSAPAPRPIAAVGKLGSLLREMNADAGQVADLQRILASGKHVVDLNPELIDPSPVRDRLDDPDSQDMDSLRESILRDGQRVPVLVRPKSGDPDRYVTVYGHRRIGIAKAANITVRAVVADMSEEDALVAQGQENNERKNTSFVERCLYARRLNERGMAIIRIAAALAAPVSTVSESVKVAERIPEELIVAIGPAPGVGRRRWLALIPHVPRDRTVCDKLVVKPDFQALSSDERFEAVFAALAAPAAGDPDVSRAARLSDATGVYMTIKKTAKTAMLTISRDAAPRSDGVSFADWIEGRLASLREDYMQGR